MLEYKECKEIAEKRAEEYGSEIDAAYKIGNDYVFDNASGNWAGVFPFVVESETGNICGIWNYLVRTDKTMDDMQEIANDV